MARKRSISPEFFTDEDIADLDPLHRLLFVGLWCQADKGGRLKDKPRTIKAMALPFDDVDVDAALQLLHERGFIVRYTAQGVGVIQIRTWEKHQNPHHTEKDSDLPPLDNADQETQERLDNGDVTVNALRAPFPETRNQKPETKNQKQTVKRFTPPTVDEVADYVRVGGLQVDAQQFVDYYQSNGWKVGRNSMKDWRAAVRQWGRRQSDFARPPNAGQKPDRTREQLLESIVGDDQ